MSENETLIETKVIEIGSVQEITHKLFEAFLADEAISTGNNKISSTDLYNQFLAYLASNNYTIKPNNKAFGRAAIKKLPFCRMASGTHYLINKI